MSASHECSFLPVGAADPADTLSAAGIDESQLIARQISAVSRLTPAMMLANIACALAVLIGLNHHGLADRWAVAWAGLLISGAGYMLARWLQLRHRPFPQRMSRRTLNRLVISCVAMGVMWAIPGLIYLPHTEGAVQALLIIIAAGMVAGGSISLYPVPLATYAFAALVAFSHVFGLLLGDNREFWPFLMLIITYLYVVHSAIQRHHGIFISEFVAQQELARKNAVIETLLEQARSETRQERRRSATRLERAQRLETVSQLTAGIAHDFNNLLAGVQGNAELLRLEGKADPSLIEPILDATDRGAKLTASLLTFASRRVLKPQTMHPVSILSLSSGVLQRALGEDVRVDISLPEDLWPVEVDPAMMEHAVLNLAANARDAMPDGGVFRITAENILLGTGGGTDEPELPPGEYVRLRLHDSGTGMAEEIAEHAFEPFYTTKPFGRGSGLGLSMVYGFVQQSGGHVAIDSAPGKGTTIELLLPRAGSPAPQTDPADEPARQGHGESILLIENDASVMRSLAQMLRSLNYRVIEAQDIHTARRHLHARPPPDLVLSDLSMGGRTTGAELAAEIRSHGIGTPFAFITGSVQGLPAAGLGHRDAGPVLTKPFLRAELSRFLRRHLDE